MDKKRYQKIRKVFLAAHQLPAEEQSPFLDEACGGDEDLRAKIERLLSNPDSGDDFLEKPAVDDIGFMLGGGAGQSLVSTQLGNPDTPMKDSGIEWLGHVPEGWDVVPLRHICGSIQTGPFGSQLHQSDYQPGGIPLANPVHLVNGHIIPGENSAVDEDTCVRLARHILQEGDILFARRGEIGRCGLVSEPEAGWLCGTGGMRVRLNGGHEAHNSQSGENATELKGVLAANSIKEKAKEEAEAQGLTDHEEEILKTMLKRGRQPNISFFAFTATPKYKTLEVFGSKGSDGKPLPFHLYSMRQAIEEGFILDVLKHYTTYRTYYKLIKSIEDDPDAPGVSYTEPDMNREKDGKPISETRLPEKFATDEYSVLIVAEKYQTGFDQPLLHTMYVDKRLAGMALPCLFGQAGADFSTRHNEISGDLCLALTIAPVYRIAIMFLAFLGRYSLGPPWLACP
ncbi:MAG: hypothetical protein KAV82_15525, partial [Phycisphaerae bacterium]|nr:hypothetical protein [Phycisphaerae bacterium]